MPSSLRPSAPRKHRVCAARGRVSRLGREDGFTLFETLIAAVVLVIGLTTLFGLLDTSLKATASTRAREGASNLARQILEDARTISYAQLSATAVAGELQAMPGLADASASTAGWQVVQRGITYTATASECAIDDPKDGAGVHEVGATYCADSAAAGTADAQPEDLKRITVDVTWTAAGRKPDVNQVETLTAAGQAPGLSASALHLESPVVAANTQPVITDSTLKVLTFAVTAPASAVAMRWSLEGSAQTPAPAKKSGTTTWTFSWSMPYPSVADGTYTVSAQAIDATGVLGPPVSIPVTLIRGTPAAVTGLKGGFNTINVAAVPTKVVELQWQANTERNVIGYRVYNPSAALVCPEALTTLSVALTCIDGVGTTTPPSPAAPNLTYSVVALYRDSSGVVQQGPAGNFAVAGGPPPSPNPPTALTLVKNADGSVTLTWSAPSSGPAVSYYRIYRGSTNYTSRYALTSAATTTYTDPDAPTTNSYWVTAVNANLAESAFLGPKTG
jgi:Tfp pilus assembly protein PilV